MSTDKFAAFRAETERTLTPPGAREARALARRQRRHTALATALAVAAVVAGTVLTAGRIDPAPQKLATPAARPEPVVESLFGDRTVHRATIDLSRVQSETCGVPFLPWDGDDGPPPTTDPQHGVILFGLGVGGPGNTGDLDLQGGNDWIAELSCDGDPHGEHQIVILTGKPPALTAIAVLPDPVTDPQSLTIGAAEDTGVLTFQYASWDGGRLFEYRYRWVNGTLERNP